jgi:hypothetical protein
MKLAEMSYDGLFHALVVRIGMPVPIPDGRCVELVDYEAETILMVVYWSCFLLDLGTGPQKWWLCPILTADIDRSMLDVSNPTKVVADIMPVFDWVTFDKNFALDAVPDLIGESEESRCLLVVSRLLHLH